MDGVNKWLTLAANIGVIAGIIFLALEIRQNTTVAQLEAYNRFVEGIIENDHFIASDTILTPLLVRVNSGAMPDEFTEEERFRIRLNYTGLLRLWEGLYRSVQTGILPPSTLEIVGKGGAFDNPYFRSIWPTLGQSFSDDFVTFIEERDWNK